VNPGSEDLYPEFENSGVRRFVFAGTEKYIFAYASRNFGVRRRKKQHTPKYLNLELQEKTPFLRNFF